MKRGVVIGKFLPFHYGHRFLISTALEACETVHVIVVQSKDYSIPTATRIDWIREEFANRNVVLTWMDQDELGLDDEDSKGWAKATVKHLGFVPDCAFTSEEYGKHWAKYMGCEHFSVDQPREKYPISGTQIRKNPTEFHDWLTPATWSYFVPRILIIGAESTGKTTLCKDLANVLCAPYVPEFGRYYTEAQAIPSRYRWTTDDFYTIARTQDRFEDDAARWANPLICDTNSFTTALFHEAYLHERDQALEGMGKRRKYDHVFLTDLETPFQQDHTEMRDESSREWFHQRYIDQYDPIIVKGTREERVDQICAILRP